MEQFEKHFPPIAVANHEVDVGVCFSRHWAFIYVVIAILIYIRHSFHELRCRSKIPDGMQQAFL
jgi:hypothetical protein